MTTRFGAADRRRNEGMTSLWTVENARKVG
jgi:hypothetical protein